MTSPAPDSFARKLQARQIYLVRGRDVTGRAAWYYVRVSKRPRDLFERAARRGQVNLTDYGDVILSGYGEGPPEAAVRAMREQWGFEG